MEYGKSKLSAMAIDDLDAQLMPMDIIIKGQDELCLDFIDVVDYMLKRGYSVETINKNFSIFAGRDIRVCNHKE